MSDLIGITETRICNSVSLDFIPLLPGYCLELTNYCFLFLMQNSASNGHEYIRACFTTDLEDLAGKLTCCSDNLTDGFS